MTVYLIAGVLFMKYSKHATGVQMIPNSEFWRELPTYIKVNFFFFQFKFKFQANKNSIKGWNYIYNGKN